jgi:hypothetical protein
MFGGNIVIFATDGINTSLRYYAFYEVPLTLLDDIEKCLIMFGTNYERIKNTVKILETLYGTTRFIIQKNIINTDNAYYLTLCRKYEIEHYEYTPINPNFEVNIYVVNDGRKGSQFKIEPINISEFENLFLIAKDTGRFELVIKFLFDSMIDGNIQDIFRIAIKNQNLFLLKLVMLCYPNFLFDNGFIMYILNLLIGRPAFAILQYLLEQNKIIFNSETKNDYLKMIAFVNMSKCGMSHFYDISKIRKLLSSNMYFNRRKHLLFLENNKESNILSRLPLDVTQIVGYYL